MLDAHRGIIHDISQIAVNEGIDLLLIGAVARDELFVDSDSRHFGRMTYDVDFACHLKNWDDYECFIAELEASGKFERSGRVMHQVRHIATGLPVDLVPFGEIESKNHTIIWPPDGDVKMNVAGYRSAFAAATPIESPNVRCIGPEWYAMLKLSTWLDSPNRGKDIEDFYFVSRHYSDSLGDERIWDADLINMEGSETYELAVVRLLGRDCASIDANFAANLSKLIFSSGGTAPVSLLIELERYTRPHGVDEEQFLNAFRLGIEDISASQRD